MISSDWFETQEVLGREDLLWRLHQACPEILGDKWRLLNESVCLDIPAFRQGPKPVPPPWSIGLSKQFKKDTSGLDRKLLGRVLEVLSELTTWPYPFKAQGDTFKPLGGELDGCWRYRIGDTRLIIQPALELAQINVLAIGARGSIYD
jgi:mRNA-degrading endonuclease RelE of RelBE toxin-antitoxin system